MDRKIEKKTWTLKRILMISGIIAFVSLSIYAFWFMDIRSTLNVERDKITISEVREDTFQEFIQVTGAVQPIQTIYLDAIEGGVVQEVFLESGTIVEEGDTILTLTNSSLQLQVMQQTSGLYDQINNVRNSRLNLEQNTLRLQEQLANAKSQMEILKAQYERQQKLIERDLISEEEFLTTKENYEYQKRRYELTYESFKKDSVQTITQMRQLNNSEQRMFQNLEAVQQILNNLAVTAPISGQLSTIELNQGQSISSGERIGQVDILDSYKVRVAIDEYHLSRIVQGLNGSFTFDGQTHELVITKIYPVINNGQFEVDMEFVGEAPQNLRRGQTLRIRLELGESASAIQIPRGGFYQTTGGNWVFVVKEDERKAYRRDIRLGRQNPEYFEVQFGLEPGEKVITSSYDTFGDNEVLVLE
ncbi:MAG: efflux RND transporter periplasmic adaptor subunit [Gracilimonas sp.]|uniref:efflux RND transporter periplasmic adaptor subunit n=1 Tax=Gracilimonas sp. TaxID=1974203 RepID=UPI0019A1A433|nr:efflux RND transporter periplasmic adaptor subunit [Gracilimonas sp.]MBD3616739.1 efflux RND transporter periplasmic adaptor subunit [Gracilimonas sp.]